MQLDMWLTFPLSQFQVFQQDLVVLGEERDVPGSGPRSEGLKALAAFDLATTVDQAFKACFAKQVIAWKTFYFHQNLRTEKYKNTFFSSGTYYIQVGNLKYKSIIMKSNRYACKLFSEVMGGRGLVKIGRTSETYMKLGF